MFLAKQMSSLAAAFLLTLLIVSISYPQVQWTPDGVAICSAKDSQDAPQLVRDGFGGAIITWQDYRSGYYVPYAQRVDANGNVLWPSNGVAIGHASDEPLSLQLVGDGAGGAIITWRSNVYPEPIYAQRVDANGNVLWTADGIAICSGERDWFKENPQLVSDGVGGAIITWQDYRNNLLYPDIYAQRVNTNGNVLWASNGVAICTAKDSQENPYLASDGVSGAIITWQDHRSGTYSPDIYAQRVDANGNIIWTASGVPICTANDDQISPNLISDGTGGAIITWEDGRYRYLGWGYQIYSQRISVRGVMLWTNNGVAICPTSSQYNTHLISDGMIGAIITWEDYRGSNNDIYAQRVGVNGNMIWTANGVPICTTDEFKQNPNLTSDGAGGAIITWQVYRGGVADDIYAQWVDANGNIIWTANGVPICTADAIQQNPNLISDGSGGAIITWSDGRNGNPDIYAQRVNYKSINISNPNGGEYWAGGSVHQILWQSKPGISVNYISLLYSTDWGITYPNTIIANAPNNGSYNWTVPNLNSSSILLKVQAKDASNGVLAEDISDGIFTIDSTPPNAFNLL